MTYSAVRALLCLSSARPAMRNLRIAIRLVRMLSQVIRRGHFFHLRARGNFRSQGESATGAWLFGMPF